ncbi:(NiFe) hydrogenase maturation protein HypF [Sulfuricella denitrificans skB26]|uniref:Carbamoyltransferase HypF n=1 Tax=Sulfuricella denitrificans (strain DSM 22764 / NBRC 105220 / skB26) TaxID=1163617 RepID=S6B1R3_SULDS|nr:carbamoyltransferase HypF [Sulfuricella denitrificans]BAN34612.1 (NiFe) hydrogenase maturation protein HypF [Sulfuricella denitrificans skB26]
MGSKEPLLDSRDFSPCAVRIRVRGQVQGVGFRPFVYRLALELELSGWVLNDADGVEIEAQGDGAALETLLSRLKNDAPDLAQVDEVSAVSVEVLPRLGFAILESRSGHAHTGITPDAAICPACLSEIFDPANRRYRYPFTNCTHCGPRYTITRHLPYDRPNTSMAKFALCPACRREYDDPLDRRFHAQPNACAVCGPRLTLLEKDGQLIESDDPIAETVRRLRAGQILAIKGIGGFHLMCDARNAETVARLRQRKQREGKPFAVMLAGIASIAPWVICGESERQLLEARERPIVLLQKLPGCDAAMPGVAPGMAELGVLLPYAPLHYLLFHEAAGRPTGTAWLAAPHALALVCTSANPGGEPLVTDNAEALRRLSAIADAFVMHDREIVVGCDDSVVRVHKKAPSPLMGEGWGEGERAATPLPNPLPQGERGQTALARVGFIRRARGYTPRAIKLPRAGRSVLACGGWFKNTICLTRGDEAFVSQHIGDLDNAATCRSLADTVQHLMGVLEIEPEVVVHDLHPDFFSTSFAVGFARQHGLPVFGVQHHHAHIASVMAEHGLAGPILGLTLDGVGLGTDGTAWGGELLRVDGARFERLGHLKELALPGGDRAAREPWRMAASALNALGRDEEIERRFLHSAATAVREMLEKNLNCPTTSSCGRLFDAAAGLLGVREISAFEGQAAMLLEGLAQAHGPVAPMNAGYIMQGSVLNFLPLLERLADTDDAGFGAALFHSTLAHGLAEWVMAARGRTELNEVVLGGGCFLNAVLRVELSRLLNLSPLTLYHAQDVPPNDGGLSLGQAWVAMQEFPC